MNTVVKISLAIIAATCLVGMVVMFHEMWAAAKWGKDIEAAVYVKPKLSRTYISEEEVRRQEVAEGNPYSWFGRP